jgi:arsenical pump membrane protein
VTAAVFPFRIGRLKIDMVNGSLIAISLLILFGIADFETVAAGLKGTNSLRPWEIIVIFFTVAYVSISLDITGIFDYFAYKIVGISNGNGRELFVFFYLFSSVLTVFTSNDIVILTLTPIIFYLGKHAKINVVPLLFAEFFGANTLSMFLYIGNPTNIIVGNSLGLGFLEYSKVMWLPSLVAALANLLLLYIVFRKEISARFDRKAGSDYNIENKSDAVISTILVLLMLTVLALSQYLDTEIWKVTSIFCVLFILKDILYGRGGLRKTVKKMPWTILPFIITFFIIMASLKTYGIVDVLASFMASFSGNLAESIFLNGTVSFLLVNLINNQPATILLSNIIVDDNFTVRGIPFLGAAYSVVIASNLGANFTLIGALAGLMWKRILKKKNLTISYAYFFKKGLLITPAVFFLTLFTLYLVLK